MTTSVFDNVLDRYVRTTLIPQMTNTVNRFMVGMVLGAGRLKANALRSQLEGLGILKGDDIDTVKLAEALRGGFAQTPEVSFMGFRFSREDADGLIRELNVAQPPPLPAQPAQPSQA